jgi:hypothetical protein
VTDRFLQIRGELESALFHVTTNKIVEARLVNRDLTVVQAFDLVHINIHANHLVTYLCKAGTRYQAYVA